MAHAWFSRGERHPHKSGAWLQQRSALHLPPAACQWEIFAVLALHCCNRRTPAVWTITHAARVPADPPRLFWHARAEQVVHENFEIVEGLILGFQGWYACAAQVVYKNFKSWRGS